jgi:kynurenine formamidase
VSKSKFIRLSHTLEKNTPSYGNRDKIFIRINSAIKVGESANSSCWIFSNNHIGTHIDVPRHFSDNGFGVADIPVSDLFFYTVELVNIPCSSARLINEVDFQQLDINPDVDLLLIRTGYENKRCEEAYWNDNPGLSPDLACYLRANFPFLRCIGFDFISITSWKYRKEGRLAHKAFLCPDDNSKTLLAIEDMSLQHISRPVKRVMIAPVYVEDDNGAPVTIFAELED